MSLIRHERCAICGGGGTRPPRNAEGFREPDVDLQEMCDACKGSGWIVTPDAESPKPPIGLMPRPLWEARMRDQRIADLFAAMGRYSETAQPIPQEWINELRDLVAGVKRDQ